MLLKVCFKNFFSFAKNRHYGRATTSLFVSQEKLDLWANDEPNVRAKRNWKQWLWIYSFLKVEGGGWGDFGN